jgi:hypothetical protein
MDTELDKSDEHENAFDLESPVPGYEIQSLRNRQSYPGRESSPV